MKSIQKFAYAAILAASTFALQPSTALAQEACGHFTLPHEVRWQNAVVPAGDYRFSYESKGGSSILTLSKMSGPRTGFMLLVNDTSTVKTSGMDRLVLLPRSGASFVSAMELPEYGMTLHFAVPSETENTVAENSTSVTAGSR